MGFAEFARMAGAPIAPPLPVDWDAVESWLKLKLPSDYKAVASAYGPCLVGNALDVHTPARDRENLFWDYNWWLGTVRRDCRSSARNDVPDEVPAFHPTRGGLLAWGWTRRGGTLFWDTSVSADPDEWTTVLYNREFPYRGISPWHRYDLSMTEFVVAAVWTGIDRGSRWGVGPTSASVKRPPADMSALEPWVAPVRRQRTDTDAARRAALRTGKGLETLAVLVRPPAEPETGGTSWDEVAAQLGTALPLEYRALMDLYGAGEWRGWLDFFSRDELAEQVETLTGFHRELREQFPQFEPLAMWPEPGGFLPFATSIDGDELGWLTLGEPDAWPVLLVPHDDEPVPRWRTGLVASLLRWARGFTPPGMPESDPLDDRLELACFTRASDVGAGSEPEERRW